MTTARHRWWKGWAVLLFACAVATARASPPDEVAFAPPRGAALPVDARFIDEQSREVRLGELLAARPAIVVPAYYGCSNLCGIVLRGVVGSLGAADLRAGRDIDVVVISIDPRDTPVLARAKARAILGEGRTGWHFLTGDEAAIGAFTRALGYRYAYDDAQRQYAHAAGITIVAPGGAIARVLYGASFDRVELLDGLRAAGDPELARAPITAGGVRTWLLCFHYDPLTGKYSFAAMNVVRAAALATLFALATFMLRHRRSARPGREGGAR